MCETANQLTQQFPASGKFGAESVAVSRSLRVVLIPLERENRIYERFAYDWTMSGDPEAAFTFVCRVCGQRIAVNATMKETLVSNGCIVCGAAAGPADFLEARSSR